jgi:hypothetical protein
MVRQSLREEKRVPLQQPTEPIAGLQVRAGGCALGFVEVHPSDNQRRG